MVDTKIKIGTNRNFGIVFGIFLIISLWPIKNGSELNLFFLLFSIIFFFLGLANSNLLTPLNKLWFKFGLFLGKFVALLVVTPTGLIFKNFLEKMC